MTEKVYIASTKMATFVCPKCRKSKTVNVSKYADLDKKVKVECQVPVRLCLYRHFGKTKEISQRNEPARVLQSLYQRQTDGQWIDDCQGFVHTGMKLQIDSDNDCDGRRRHSGRISY